MKAIIKKSNLYGELNFADIAPSKSLLHREIICSALSKSEKPVFNSKDITATYNAMSHILVDDYPCDVGESGSTLRFLIPLSVLLGGRTFITHGNLIKRPLDEYSCMRYAKIKIVDNKVITSGELYSGTFTLRGDKSSQFISGLMFVLPLLNGTSTIKLTTPLESSAYVFQTIQVLKRYGIEINTINSYEWEIIGGQKYRPNKSIIEGDWSYAANYVVANRLGAKISLLGLDDNSLSADKAIKELILCDKVDISQSPDIFPILCVNACAKQTKTLIYNAKRLKIKESDRLNVMCAELKKLGARIVVGDDFAEIEGTGSLFGGIVNSNNDHRIAMALTIAGLLLCNDDVIIENSECVEKSCPDFYKHIKMVGGDVEIRG